MRGWSIIPLGDLCHIELGGTPPRASARYWDRDRSTGNVWLSIADLPTSLNPVVSDSKEYLSDEGAARGKVVKEGTLLVSFKLTLGRLAYAGRDLRTNEAIAALPIKDTRRLEKDYLYWYLTYFDWEKAAEGEDKVKGKTLNKAKLKELPILLPPLEEQRRIVAVLDEAFAAIATATANAERNLANARDAFSAERERALSKGQAGGREANLRDLCNIKHGFAFKSEYFTEAGDYMLLTPGNFYEAGGYRDRGQKQKYYEGPIPPGFVLEAGSLLVAMTEQAAGLLGSPIIVPSDGQFLHNQRLGLVEPHAGVEWDNRFFFHVFNTLDARAELHKTGTGVKVRHTSPEKIGRLKVAFPTTLTEQRRVAERLELLSDELSTLVDIQERKLSRLEDLRRSILSYAFSPKTAPEVQIAA